MEADGWAAFAEDIPTGQSVVSDSEHQHAPALHHRRGRQLAPRQHVSSNHSDILWPILGTNEAQGTGKLKRLTVFVSSQAFGVITCCIDTVCSLHTPSSKDCVSNIRKD